MRSSANPGGGSIRRHPAIGIVVLIAILSLSVAIPAAAASKTRVYKGETSQIKPFSVRVLKADDGQRYFKGFSIEFVLACEDASTQNGGWAGAGVASRTSLRTACS